MQQLRQFLRPAAADFVAALGRNAFGSEALVIAEAIEAIREEAATRGWGGARALPDAKRARLMRELRERDIAEAWHVLLQRGETEFFAWLERKLAHHVPYRTLSDAALDGLVRIGPETLARVSRV